MKLAGSFPQAPGGALNPTFALTAIHLPSHQLLPFHTQSLSPAHPPSPAFCHCPGPSRMAASSYLNHHDSVHLATQTLFHPQQFPTHPQLIPVLPLRWFESLIRVDTAHVQILVLLCDLQQVTLLLCASSAQSLK